MCWDSSPLPPPPQHPFSVSQPITCPLYSAGGDYLVKAGFPGWMGWMFKQPSLYVRAKDTEAGLFWFCTPLPLSQHAVSKQKLILRRNSIWESPCSVNDNHQDFALSCVSPLLSTAVLFLAVSEKTPLSWVCNKPDFCFLFPVRPRW